MHPLNIAERTYGIAVGITTTENLCLLRTSDLTTIHTGETMFYGGFTAAPIRLAHGSRYAAYFSEEGIYTLSGRKNRLTVLMRLCAALASFVKS